MKIPKAKDYLDYLAEYKKMTRKEVQIWLKNYLNYGWTTKHVKKKPAKEDFSEEVIFDD